MHMDDLLIGADTIQDAIRMHEELQDAEFSDSYRAKAHFSDELTCLSENKPIPLLSQIERVRLSFDKDRLFRVQGRAHSKNENYGNQNLILLPKATHFTTLSIRKAHMKFLHGGVRNTLIEIPQADS
ncbi:hypothetical protein HPB49_018190 [Dermacentor silvarum]|uniref:Uncharacterized protein n=1 Tax=Dermacentor silvarum TaxID=543639 RepID=A0ACB8DFI8_DERSI|nr:hypothetical protein HPB49_018190 [Dermacentor silvarum]